MPASPAWETASAASLQPEQADGDAIDVNVQDRHIYITVRRPQQVSVALHTRANDLHRQHYNRAIPPAYRIQGIYILKIGTTTRRVTV